MPEDNSVFKDDQNIYGSKIEPKTKPEREIGVDIADEVLETMVEVGATKIDESKINSFSGVARTRDQVYTMLDTMAEDPKVSSVLATFTADATETNEAGKVMWAESSKADVAKYVNFLLETLNVDKNLYKWIYSLCKYGDLYIRRYRESETEDVLSKDLEEGNGRDRLNEDVKVVAFDKNDNFVDYVEMVPNPAEMFELVKFGKTYAYIQAELNTTQTKEQVLFNSFYRYRFTRGDVKVFQPTMFVHASLEDNPSRAPEEIQIFTDENMTDESSSSTYKVNKGQSILYDKYKLWRELTLLENSLLLNRVTKSSVIRLLKIKVGDMPKDRVVATLNRIKSMIEQKTAFRDGSDISEYTNPGPMENILYLPLRGEIGDIVQETLGGSDIDVKGIADIEYYQGMFYGAFGIPKQYFGATNDNTGFNGGTSLTVISKSYAKKVKRIQNAMCQAITTLINLMLIDKKLNSYVNDFEIRMQSPITQDDVDRKDTLQGRVQIMGDILNNLSDLDNVKDKLKITKALLSNIVTDSEIIEILQSRIDELEKEEKGDVVEEATEEETTSERPRIGGMSSVNDLMSGGAEEESEEETTLPNARDLGIDFTKNTEEEI